MKISDLPFVMIKCLVLTILIECLVAYFLKYRKKDLLNILLVNILTNPIVSSVPVYFNVKYGVSGRNISLLVLELLVLVVEGFIYHKYLNNKKINPYLLSLILNGSSYLLGVLINLVWVWKYEKNY